MTHETALIFTLAAAFALAFLFGMLVSRIGLPPLVGYLLAGIVIGPFTPGYVADTGLAPQLAEVGVILLMFGVGLHFSVGDLLAVRRVAIPGALLRIAIVTAGTAAMTRFWNWPWGAGVVLGVALSVASTVLVLRQLGDRGLLDSADGRAAVGWLVVEDLAMVLTLVLLPPLAGAMGGTPPPGAAHGTLAAQLGITLLKVFAFVAVMLFAGTRVVPWILERVARTGSRELFTLAVLAVALGIAVGAASLFGVSFALGAFFAGVVISESDLSHQAAAEALPLQDAFAVLFFVSVGMLFDPAVLVREPGRIATVVVVVIAGKALVTFGLALVLRRPVRSALLLAASLAQIGEFSFILAGLGISVGLLPAPGRDVILAAAILSITLNPLAFTATAMLGSWIERRPRLVAALERPTIGPAIPVAGETAPLRDHVVLVGYGRVGRRIGDALAAAHIPFIAVERDRIAVENLRKRGLPAVFGDAARPGILDHVQLNFARLLVIAAPDAYQVRRVVELARAANPALRIAARTHSENGQAFLERLGVARAFMGERELALSMAHFALTSMGRTDDEADAAVDELRRQTSLRMRAMSPGAT